MTSMSVYNNKALEGRFLKNKSPKIFQASKNKLNLFKWVQINKQKFMNLMKSNFNQEKAKKA